MIVERLLELTLFNLMICFGIEKEEITGSRVHRTIFEWTDYPLGILQVKRSKDKNANYDFYDCIWKVTLIEK